MKLFAAFTALSLLAGAALAADPEFTVAIKEHRITPEVLEVPANTKFKLIVDNQDPTPEEAESHTMKFEKVIMPNSKATLKVGPLKPGTYEWFGEFNEKTAQAKIVAK